MSGGEPLGRAVLALDVDLGPLRQGLNQGHQLTRSWMAEVEKSKAVLSIDTSGMLADIAGVDRAMSRLRGQDVVVSARADVDSAIGNLEQLDRELAAVDQTPAVIQVRADTDQAVNELQALQTEIRQTDAMSIDVSTRMAGLGGALSQIGKGALGAASGIGIASAASNVLGSAIGFVADSMLGANVELENARATLVAFTKDGAAADAILADIREEAARTPFAFGDMAEAVGSLLPVSKQANTELMGLVETAEILAASNPAEGLTGAAFALREAVSGDFTSIIERFNLPRVYINRLKEEGVPALEIVRSAMTEMGYDISLVSNLSETASGKWSTFMDTLREAGRRIGEPLFEKAKDALDELIQYTETPAFEENIAAWTEKAEALGDAIGEFVQNDGPMLVTIATDTAAAVVKIAEAGIRVYDIFSKIKELGAGGGENPLPDEIPSQNGAPPVPVPDTDDGGGGLWDLGKKLDSLNPVGVTNFTNAIIGLDNALSELNSHPSSTEIDIFMHKVDLAYDPLYQLNTQFPVLTENLEAMSAEQLIAAGRADEAAVAADRQAEAFTALYDGYGELTAAQISTNVQQAGFAENLRRINMDTLDYVTTLSAADQALYATGEAFSTLMVSVDGLAGAYQVGLDLQGQFSAQGAEFQGQLSSLEETYGILQERQAQGIQLTTEEQTFLDRYPTLYGRLSGGIEDATVQTGLLAAGNAELMLLQDQVNAQFPDLVAGTDAYNEALKGVALSSGMSEEEFNSMVNNAGGLQGVIAGPGGLTEAINGLITTLLELGVQKPEPSVELDTSGFDSNIKVVGDEITVTGSKVATPKVDADTSDFDSDMAHVETEMSTKDGHRFTLYADLDTSAFDTGIAHIKAFTPASPAKEGPLRELPRWGALTDDLGPAMDQGVTFVADGTAAIAGYLPRSGRPADMGPLSTTFTYDWLFAGVDMAADDAGERIGQAVAGWLTDLESFASGDALSTAQDALAELFNIQAVLVETKAPQAAIDEVGRQIAAKQAEIQAIGGIMGTDVVEGMIAQMAEEDAAGRIAEILRQGFEAVDLSGAIDFDDQLAAYDEQIRQLGVLRDAAIETGNVELAREYQERINALAAEQAAFNDIIATDSVQSWIAYQQSLQDAAAAQELLTQTQADSIAALAAGGTASANYFTGLQQDYERAKAALDFGKLLGVSPEEQALLQADFDAAAATVEAGADALGAALLAGTVDDATLAELITAGGEWFEAFYDSLFGQGALDQVAEGMGILTEIPIDKLLELAPQMSDGGASLIDELIAGATSGAISYEQLWAFLAAQTAASMDGIEATVGMSVAEQIAHFTALRDTILTDLAEAYATGAITAAEYEEQLRVVNQVLADLEAQANDAAAAIYGLERAQGAATKQKGKGSVGVLTQEAADAGAAAAEAALQAAKDTLEIGSPSERARREVGRPFNQGIALGIGDSERLLVDTSVETLDTLARIYERGFADMGERAGEAFAKAMSDPVTAARLEAYALAGGSLVGRGRRISDALTNVGGSNVDVAGAAGEIAFGEYGGVGFSAVSTEDMLDEVNRLLRRYGGGEHRNYDIVFDAFDSAIGDALEHEYRDLAADLYQQGQRMLAGYDMPDFLTQQLRNPWPDMWQMPGNIGLASSALGAAGSGDTSAIVARLDQISAKLDATTVTVHTMLDGQVLASSTASEFNRGSSLNVSLVGSS